MPNNQTNLNIGIKYNVDQASVNAVKKSLQDLQNINFKNFKGPRQDLDQIKRVAGQVQSALTKAFNVNLNSLNTQQFNASLKQAQLSVDKIYSSFSKAGAQGQVAFSRMASEVLTTNMQLKQTNSLVSQMGETMANTVKWGIASSVMNNFTNSVRQAFDYVKALDSSLNDIRIVTKQSSDEMANFAVQANNSAQALGRSTMDYTKAALTFYQQGLDEASVQARTESVLKAQNITGAGEEMADYLTAVWNGYKVANEEAELYVDKLAAVADSSASNMSQLAIAMSKVASSANLLGVPVDNLNAQIATIVATTRQAPESVGNALKTIYSRINDIATGADDAEISLGNYSSKMAQVGINVLDANGRLRDTGDVIDEIGGKWETLSHEQQIYLARTMAGQRQYNNLLALFENWGKYSDLVNVSMEAQGATAQKNAIYMESLSAKMEQLGAAGEKVKAALIDEDDLKGLVDFGTGAVNLFGNLIQSIGGGKGALLAFGSIFTQVFSGTIAKELNNIITNFQNVKTNAEQIAQLQNSVKLFGSSKGYENQAVKEMVNLQKDMMVYSSALTSEQRNQYNQLVKEIGEQQNKLSLLKQQDNQAKSFAQSIAKANNIKLGENFKDFSIQLEQGMVRATTAAEKVQEVMQKTNASLMASSTKKGQSGFTVFEDFLNQVDQLNRATGNSLPSFQRYQDAISAIQNKTRPTKDEIIEVRLAAKALADQLNKRYDNYTNSLDVVDSELEKINNKLKLLKQSTEQMKNSAKQAFDVKNIVTFASSIGQLTTGINNLINLTKIWGNENLSAGEKILQTVTNLGFTIPLLFNSVRNIGKVLGVNQILAEKRLLTQKKITLQKQQQLFLSKAESSQDIWQAALIGEEIQDVKKQISNLPSVFGTASNTITGALSKIGSGISNFITTPLAGIPFLTGGVVLAIGAAAAVIGVALYKAWNKASDAAKEAAQNTKKAQQAYNDLRDSYSNLKSSLDDLTTAQDHLSDLTKGTQEWRDALQEVNEKVLTLIQEFPELKQYITSTQDGLLGLTEGGQEAARDLYQQRTLASGLSYAALDQASTQAQNYSDITDLSRELDGILGLTPDELQQVITAINQHGSYILKNSDTLDKYTNISQKDIDVVLDNTDKIITLAAQVEANTTASQALTNSILQSSLVDSQQYQRSSNQEAFARLVQNAFKNVQLDDSYFIKYVQDGIEQSFKDTEAISKAYSELIGGAEVKSTFWGDYKYKDQSGQWQKISAQVVESAVAYQDAVENASQIYDQIANTIESLGQKQAGLYSLFVNGLDKLDLSKISIKDIQDIINNKQFIKQIANLLDVSVNQVYQKLGESSTSIAQGTKDYVNSLPEGIKSAFKEIAKGKVSELNFEAQEAIGDLLKQSLIRGIDSFKNTKDILKDLNTEDILHFKELINNLDFSNLSVNQFRNYLSDAEIQLNATDQQLLQFIKYLKEISEISPEENYKNIHDIINDLNAGDIITAQQASILEEAGVDINKYFTYLADGSLELKQDAQSFYNYVNDLSIEPFIQKINEALNRNDSLAKFGQNFNNNNFNIEDFTSSAAGDVNKSIKEPTFSYDENLLSSQLEFLNAIEDKSIQILDIQKRHQEGQQLTFNQVNKVAQAVQNQKDKWSEIPQIIQQNNELIARYQQQLANSVEDFDQLQQLVDSGVFSQDSDFYKEGRQSAIEAAAERVGVSTSAYEAYANSLEKAMLANEEFIGTQEDAEKASEKMAQQMYNLNEGLQSLQDNWDKYNETLSSGVTDAPEYAEAIGALTDSIEAMFGIPVSSDFVSQHLEQIRSLAQGDITVIDQLAQAATQDYIMRISADVEDEAAKAQLASLSDYIANMELDDIQIGTSLDDGPLVQGLNKMLADMTITEQQANAILKGIGYTPQITYKQVPMASVSQSQATGASDVQTVMQFPVFDGKSITYYPVTMTQHNATTTAGGTAENGMVSVPQINASGTKYTGASSGAAVSPNLKSPRGGGKGGSGGKGGGSKPKQPTVVKGQKLSEAKDSIKDRSDVYHDINLALEKQEDKLDDIQKEQKKLVNKDRLKNLQQQNKELEKQKSLLDQKSGIAASELVRLRNELVADLGNSIKFDQNGQIANYNKALDQARDNYNASIDDYNKKVWAAQEAYNKYVQQYNSMSGQAQQANKTQLEKQKDIMDQTKKSAQKSLDLEKEKYDAIKNNVKEYDDTLKLQRDIANQQQEIQNQIYDNLIAISKIKVDLSIDTGDFERDWLDFENKFIKKLDKDDFLGNAKASAKELMSYFNSKQVQQTANQIKKIRDQIAIMNAGGTSNIYGTNLAQAQEDLEEYMKQQMDDLQQIQDLVDNIKDNYLDAIDDARDKMDDQIDQYERVNDLVEHNMKMVQLLYGDKAYDSMQKYYNLQQKNNESELESLKKQQDYWKKKMDNEVVGSDAWKKFKDNLDDATDDLNSKLEDMIENLSDKWQNRVDGIIAKLNNALTGGRGLDYLDEQWDYINNYDDQFLDTFESKTGIDEVERLYQSTIDGLAGSPKSQQALNKLMNDQLKLLRQKDHLTEYDLERAKASLEVEKARLALEEARDNKTKMRLRRDSQGNYTYQYVADEQKLDDLQAALADAQANLYNMDKEHYKQNLDDLYDTYKNYLEKRKELEEEYAKAKNAKDQEEKARITARWNLLQEQYDKFWNGLSEDNKYTLLNLGNSFADGMGIDKAAYSASEFAQIMNQNIPQVQSNIQDLHDKIAGEGGLINATADAVNNIKEATQSYNEEVNKTLESAGTSVDTIMNVTDAAGKALDKNIQQANDLITTNQKLIDECNAQVDAIQKLLSWLDQYLNKVMNVQTLISNLRSAYGTGQQLNGSNLTADQINVESMGLDTTAGMNFTGNPKTDAAAVKQQIDALMAQYEKFLTQMSIATFDTGGYTGSWGDAEGRLAFLHQGELVLNQDDTRNILSAVQMVRSMANAINGFASGEINSLMSNATGLLGGISNTEQLDQNVHIEANFPNVTQHTEIEQAFNNLVNMASMRASGYRD